MKVTQVESGKAWEFGLARELAYALNQPTALVTNTPCQRAQSAYALLPSESQERIECAAREATLFLRAHDPRLLQPERVEIQPDQKGTQGDVRDVLVYTRSGVVGISAKHRHNALKHSRIGSRLDFGESWYGIPCSDKYWGSIEPVFEILQSKDNATFRELEHKQDIVYVPLLRAFIDETLANAHPAKLLRYLVGSHDFYKVIKDNGNVIMQSFNLGGTLAWGYRLPLPRSIIQFALKPGYKNTAILTLDEGWQISFRIHNARSKIEMSLKFDIRLVGNPQQLSRHEILYG